MNQVTLERYTYGMQARLSEHFGIEADVKIYPTASFLDEITIQIVQKIFGQQRKLFREKVPLNWKEAVKDRWLPQWIRKYWPIKYRLIEFDVRELMPSLNIPNRSTYIVTDLQETIITDPPILDGWRMG